MEPFQLFALLTTLAALFSWLNHLYLRVPGRGADGTRGPENRTLRS